MATKKVGGDQAQLYIHLQYFVSQLKLKICTTKIKDFGECTSSGGSSGEVYYFGYSPLPMICPDDDFKRNSPLDLLKRRLATGEINNEEYLEKKKIMES